MNPSLRSGSMKQGMAGIVARMTPVFFHRPLLAMAFFASVLLAPAAESEPSHGIAMYGDPALPPDFVSLPYADPEAPKGGRIVTGNVGGFDSLNPFILKGAPRG